jgi:Cytochrome P460
MSLMMSFCFSKSMARRSSLLLIGLAVASACSDDGDSGDAQTPPTSGSAVESWLADGMYKSWASESAVHAARSPSPHGFNRIYSNDLIAKNVAGVSAWPKGAASVKELYASATDTTPIGFAVYLKTAADSANGANWYWYERITMNGAKNVVADGMGDKGTPLTICVGCHGGAGSDAAHTPSTGGRDQVYTPVP